MKHTTKHLYSKEDFEIVSTPFSKPLPKGVGLTMPKAKMQKVVSNEKPRKFVGRPVDNTLMGRLQAKLGHSELGKEVSLLMAGAKKIKVMG